MLNELNRLKEIAKELAELNSIFECLEYSNKHLALLDTDRVNFVFERAIEVINEGAADAHDHRLSIISNNRDTVLSIKRAIMTGQSLDS